MTFYASLSKNGVKTPLFFPKVATRTKADYGRKQRTKTEDCLQLFNIIVRQNTWPGHPPWATLEASGEVHGRRRGKSSLQFEYKSRFAYGRRKALRSRREPLRHRHRRSCPSRAVSHHSSSVTRPPRRRRIDPAEEEGLTLQRQKNIIFRDKKQ